MGIGWSEVLVIFLVILLVFGAKRIPEIAKALGRATYEFKKARREIEKETESLIDESEKHADAASKAESGDDKARNDVKSTGDKPEL